MTDLPDRIAFSNRDPVLEDALALIQSSCLDELVRTSEQRSITGRGLVTDLTPVRDVKTWSTGERLLWQFVASLAGRASIDLFELATRFRGEPEEPGIIVALLGRIRGEWR